MYYFLELYLKIGMGEAMVVILLNSPKTFWQWFRHIPFWFPILMVGVVGKGKW